MPMSASGKASAATIDIKEYCKRVRNAVMSGREKSSLLHYRWRQKYAISTIPSKAWAIACAMSAPNKPNVSVNAIVTQRDRPTPKTPNSATARKARRPLEEAVQLIQHQPRSDSCNRHDARKH